MSSIMRWRRAEIGLVIGGLLSVGLHERAILADRTPPTDDPTPIGTANGPKGIYGRRSLSKPPKPTILDLSHRPHHKRLPRQRFSAMTGYGILCAALVHEDVRLRLWSVLPRRVSFPKTPSGPDSRDEGESAHHPERCSYSFSCLGRLSPACSGRGAGLRSRTSFFAISSILL
jgi:hypothetical protein